MNLDFILRFDGNPKTPKQHICHCQSDNDLIAMVTNGSVSVFLVLSILTVAQHLLTHSPVMSNAAHIHSLLCFVRLARPSLKGTSPKQE